MKFTNTSNRYGCIAKLLHWCIAILLLLQYLWIFCREYLYKDTDLAIKFLTVLHKPLGTVVLVLAIFAILWKSGNVAPKLPAMPYWQQVTAKVVHWLLYLGAILMPLSGILMSVANGYSVNLFDLYSISAFDEKNPTIAAFSHTSHYFLSIVMAGLVVLHVAAALKHHFIDRDWVLLRMLPFR